MQEVGTEGADANGEEPDCVCVCVRGICESPVSVDRPRLCQLHRPLRHNRPAVSTVQTPIDSRLIHSLQFLKNPINISKGEVFDAWWAVMHFLRCSGKHATQVPSHVLDVQGVGTEGADANGEEPDQKARWADMQCF